MRFGIAFLALVAIANATTPIQRFLPLRDLFVSVCGETWESAPKSLIAGQIEQESGWKTHAELKTSREYGFGLSATTLAFNKDGSTRFNNFQKLKEDYSKRLSGWSWANRFDPRYNMTAMLLLDHQNYMVIAPWFDDQKSKFDASITAYNCGAGRIRKDIEVCKYHGGKCRQFQGGVAKFSSLGNRSLGKGYSGRSASDIYHSYAPQINQRSEKYRRYLP